VALKSCANIFMLYVVFKALESCQHHEKFHRPLTTSLIAVTIQEKPEEIGLPGLPSTVAPSSPSLLGSHSPRIHRASISGKKLSGRPSFNKDASVASLTRQISTFSLDSADGDRDGPENRTEDPSALLSQVVMWLHEEKSKRSAHTSKSAGDGTPSDKERPKTSGEPRPGSESQHPDDALALDNLERILAGFMVSGSNNVAGLGHRGSVVGRRKSSVTRKSKRGLTAASSDTEYQDGDFLVPNVEAVLDNSKLMDNPAAQTDNDITTVKSKDKDQWIAFKCEVVRLTHTLRLKGWRRVPMEQGADIDVQRLSGALTNAVYVVSPPKNLPEPPATSDSATTSAIPARKRRPPAKLLLRIYGPQVEHLIDRQGELAILRRLARKRIGPRLLGTFSNGRFEEFFHARTLTPEDLRVPETSKQIAKRMRELHDGVELLEEERDAGPFVWRNWDKWVNRCEQAITWLDKQIIQQQRYGIEPKHMKRWMRRGFVCGVEWPMFRQTVEKYRKQIEKTHGGKSGIREQLVFAHNDVSPLEVVYSGLILTFI
jgi:choline kinase